MCVKNLYQGDMLFVILERSLYTYFILSLEIRISAWPVTQSHIYAKVDI